VSFTLTRADLEFQDARDQCVAEPGTFRLWIAPSSAAGEPVQFELLPPR